MPHNLSPVQVQEYAVLWGMNDVEEGIHLVDEYADLISEDTHFVTAFMIPMPKGMPGVLIAISTALSTRILHENVQTNSRGEIIEDPH